MCRKLKDHNNKSERDYMNATTVQNMQEKNAHI